MITMIRKTFLLFLSVFISQFIFSQQPQTKEDLQKQQQQLQQEINSLNNSLNSIKKNKKESLGQLALVQRKIRAREQLISTINKDLRRISDNIYFNQLEINRLNRELDTLKIQYSKSVVYAYKNRSNYDYLNFLFSATSFNDALKRVSYLKSYREYRESQSTNIQNTQNLLQQKIGSLSKNRSEKSLTLNDQSKQLNVLEQDKKDKDRVVKGLKNRENDIASLIRNKERQRQKLAQSLASVIKREIDEANRLERERLAKNKNEGPKKTTPKTDAVNPTSPNITSGTKRVATPKSNDERSYSPFESTEEGVAKSVNFEQNRGRLPWPIDAGFIAGHFGRETIPGTILVRTNDGIIISLPNSGMIVKSVADGEVSSVFDLGGEQAIVIRHGKYFTTYSNLGSISVVKNQVVRAGTILGKALSNEDGEGEITFMVSNDKSQFLDPEKWLKRR